MTCKQIYENFTNSFVPTEKYSPGGLHIEKLALPQPDDISISIVKTNISFCATKQKV